MNLDAGPGPDPDADAMQAFGLATLSAPSSQPFAAMVIEDRALPLFAFGLGDATVLDLLDRWTDAWPKLERAAGDAARFASAPPVSAFRVHPPHRPRQVFCSAANDAQQRPGATPDASDCAATTAGESPLPSRIVGPHDDLVWPANVDPLDARLALGVVIGRRARHVGEADAMDCVAGFAVVCELTARGVVRGLPLGPCFVPGACAGNPRQLDLRLAVDGLACQDQTGADTVHRIERQVAQLSARQVLLPGDVICIGSACAAGLHPGAAMQASISGLGSQRHRCARPS